MAGLAAAASLSEAGFDVVLLEAADYLGGRVKQVQPFKGFAPIDLGGEFIHGSDSIINRTAKENGWVVEPCYKCEGMANEYMFYYNGELHPLLSSHPDIQKAWKAWDDIIFFWEKVPKNDLHQSADHFHKQGREANCCDSSPQDAVADHTTQGNLESVKNSGVECRQDSEHDGLNTPLRDMSIQEWLERKQCNEDVIAVFKAMYCQTVAATPRHMGLFESAREENAWQYGDGNYRLAESYSQLVEHLLNKCANVDKRLCWQVKEIDWRGKIGQKADEIQDTPKTNGKVCLKNQHGEMLSAKYVVITVPLTILKDGDISFIPALPAKKKRAIDTIQMRGALKIVCRFKSQFWPDNLNLIYSVRGFLSQIWMYTRDAVDSDDKCHVIAGFETAEPAEKKINLSGQEVLDGFLKHLDEIFRTDLNPHPATDSFMDYVYYHWSKHPFIRGGYSSPTVHAYGLRDELASPVEDCLFFAGEATSVTACATVHTAMETGFRAAREVCSLAKRVHTQ
ncbi:hypothetical protein ACROYT_G039712 [Oculina patagonica]